MGLTLNLGLHSSRADASSCQAGGARSRRGEDAVDARAPPRQRQRARGHRQRALREKLSAFRRVQRWRAQRRRASARDGVDLGPRRPDAESRPRVRFCGPLATLPRNRTRSLEALWQLLLLLRLSRDRPNAHNEKMRLESLTEKQRLAFSALATTTPPSRNSQLSTRLCHAPDCERLQKQSLSHSGRRSKAAALSHSIIYITCWVAELIKPPEENLK